MAAAEQLYDALYQWKKQGSLAITKTSLAFFQDLLPTAAPGNYSSSTSTYANVTVAVKSYADGFLAVVQQYTPSNGSLAEQFSRDNGTPISARDLTWSYAAFLTAANSRQGVVPGSWGAKNGNKVPSECKASAAAGTYEKPTIPRW